MEYPPALIVMDSDYVSSDEVDDVDDEPLRTAVSEMRNSIGEENIHSPSNYMLRWERIYNEGAHVKHEVLLDVNQFGRTLLFGPAVVTQPCLSMFLMINGVNPFHTDLNGKTFIEYHDVVVVSPLSMIRVFTDCISGLIDMICDAPLYHSFIPKIYKTFPELSRKICTTLLKRGAIYLLGNAEIDVSSRFMIIDLCDRYTESVMYNTFSIEYLLNLGMNLLECEYTDRLFKNVYSVMIARIIERRYSLGFVYTFIPNDIEDMNVCQKLWHDTLVNMKYTRDNRLIHMCRKSMDFAMEMLVIDTSIILSLDAFKFMMAKISPKQAHEIMISGRPNFDVEMLTSMKANTHSVRLIKYLARQGYKMPPTSIIKLICKDIGCTEYRSFLIDNSSGDGTWFRHHPY
jgi:hypothetical protein